MTTELSNAVGNARANLVRDAIDASGAGSLVTYDGARAADVSTPPAGNVLVTFALPNPVAPNAVGQVSVWNSIPATNIALTGTATWFRVFDNAGTAIFDGDVGITGSGADLEFDTVAFVAGRIISIDAFQHREG